MRLTAKQLAFIDQYLVDLNGKRAAIRAGYARGSAEVTASKLLRLAKVQQAIGVARAKLAAATGITAERVVNELAKIAFVDVRKIVGWRSDAVAEVENPDTGEMELVHRTDVAMRSSADLDPDTAAAVKEVSVSLTGTLKVKLYDKRQALNDLGRHLGLFDKKPAQPPKAPDKGDTKQHPTVPDAWADDLDHTTRQ